MDYGALNSYFEGVAAKSLSGVDLSANRSHQHEFNGTAPLRLLFGDDDVHHVDTTFTYLTDGADPTIDRGFSTWYDARRKHPTRTEYRLYYNDNAAIDCAAPGDLMVIALTKERRILVLFAKQGSTVEAQLRWLFGLDDVSERYVYSETSDLRVSSIAATILETVGIEVALPSAAEHYLDGLIERFGEAFPKGAEFSAYSVSTLSDLDWKNDPDSALIACYDREEMLFRVFERHLLERDLSPFLTFGALDVDGVLKVTMSAFQRRKSRAGTAFENQISSMLDARGIEYSSQKYTEGKSKPDFIFPSIELYKNEHFPAAELTMLGAKTTIKERWRQVLEEADRVENKHLITLEPAVSLDYTKAMKRSKLQLVVPKQLFNTYAEEQRDWLMCVKDFCELVEQRQAASRALKIIVPA